MSSPTPIVRKLTPEEYLAMELESPVKHEYVAGEIYAMTGTTDTHNIISINIVAILRNHLRGSNCRVFMADLKLKLGLGDSYYYPDLMVSCEKAASRYFRERPTLLVEVLSDSTAKFDAGEKRQDYQNLPSLQEYVLVSQECMDVRVYRREAEGWCMDIYTDGMVIPLRSVDLEIPIERVYEEAWESP